MTEFGREPAPEDLDLYDVVTADEMEIVESQEIGGFMVGGQRVGVENMAGQAMSDADDHFTAESMGQPPLTVFAREVPTSPLELSRALQTRLAEVRGGEGGEAARSSEELTRRLRMNIESMHVELAELLMELPWKEWKDYPPDFITADRMAAILEECIDLHFFLNNMYLALGLNDEKIQSLYEQKFQKNMARQADGGAYRGNHH